MPFSTEKIIKKSMIPLLMAIDLQGKQTWIR
jgi:hypothetical protein